MRDFYPGGADEAQRAFGKWLAQEIDVVASCRVELGEHTTAIEEIRALLHDYWRLLPDGHERLLELRVQLAMLLSHADAVDCAEPLAGNTTSGQESRSWWQVDLGSSVDIEKVEIYNRLDCCADRLKDHHVLVSEQPFAGTLDEVLANPAVRRHHDAEQAGRPTVIEIPAKGRYLRVWLAGSVPQELNMAEAQVLGRSAS